MLLELVGYKDVFDCVVVELEVVGFGYCGDYYFS